MCIRDRSSIEEKLESIRTSSQKSPSQYLDSVKNEVLELKQKMCIRDSLLISWMAGKY